MLITLIEIAAFSLLVAMVIVIVAVAYRAKLKNDMNRDVKKAFEAIIALEPALSGKKPSELKLSNTVVGEDDYVVEYGDKSFLKLSPASVSALNVYMEKYRRADLLLRISVYIFGTCVAFFSVLWIAYFALN
ncbi:hypothetical protein IK110_04150 [Candidatus Saccharibacteria bacterium]|nr:hypothetical protein [Candidatus Saccharibacteria bacterium]